MITNYTDLQTTLAAWVHRADLTAQIPTFIQLAEARFNRKLRMPQQLTTLTGTVSDGLIQLPADLRVIMSLRIAVGSTYVPIDPLPPEYLSEAEDTSYSNGTPYGYVLVGNQANIVGETGSPAFKLTYWQKVPALSSTNSTNWLLAREPGIYLYGSLVELSPYMADDERVLIWATQYKNIVDEMDEEADAYRYGNGARMQPPMRNVP